jgi:hypothetical protein
LPPSRIFGRHHGGPDNWGEVLKFTASDAAGGDTFGKSVAIFGDTAVVGASLNDDNGRASGSAYIFGRNHGGADNWGEVTKITASDAATRDFFGTGAISGDTVIVGAHQGLSGEGSAYIFGRNHGGPDNWGEVIKLTASDGARYDQFGGLVAISGDTAIVGANGNDDAGSAYIFERNHGGVDNWGEVIKLTASDATFADNFGVSVSISGDTAIVGARFNDDAGGQSGAAYIFGRNHGGTDNWGEVIKLTASDAAADDRFGQDVAIFGDIFDDLDSHWIVGAALNDDAGSASGSAYIYVFPEPTTLWLFGLGSAALLRRRRGLPC